MKTFEELRPTSLWLKCLPFPSARIKDIEDDTLLDIFLTSYRYFVDKRVNMSSQERNIGLTIFLLISSELKERGIFDDTVAETFEKKINNVLKKISQEKIKWEM